MKVVVDKNDLVNALTVVEKALPSNAVVPITAGLLLQAKESKLVIVANNLDYRITGVVSAETDQDGELVVPKAFIGAAKAMPDDIIKLEATADGDSHSLRMTSGKSSFNFYPESAEEFPVGTPEEEWVYWQEVKFNSADLKDIINMVAFSVSKEHFRPAFMGVKLSIHEDGRLACVSSDTFRVSYVEKSIEEGMEPVDFLIPGKALGELVRIINNQDISCFFSHSEIVFDLGDYVFATRLIDQKYPDVASAFSDDNNTTVVVDPSVLKKMVDRASLMAGKGDPKVFIYTKEDQLGISAEGDTGSMNEVVPASIEGEEIESVVLNPKFITEPLKHIKGKDVTIGFNGRKGPMVISEDSDSVKFKYLALPML